MIDHKTTAHVDELTREFRNIALKQDKALLDLDSRAYNKLYSNMKKIESQLKQLPGDQRAALLPLLEHSNHQVRLRAAKAVLAIAPDAAFPVLRALAEVLHTPQAADARHCLMKIEDGTYRPE